MLSTVYTSCSFDSQIRFLMQSAASCAWQAENSIDIEYARKTLLCAYAELCRNAYQTARTLAQHSRPAQNKPSPRQVIDALRHEIAGVDGTVHTLRPLLEYVLVQRKLPSRPLVHPHVIARLFEHFSGARQLTAHASSAASLGDALYDCLTRGCRLCDRSDVNCDGSAWSLVPAQPDANENIKCTCNVCSAVQMTKCNWHDIRSCTDALQSAVLSQCDSLECRVKALEMVLHHRARQQQ